MQIKKFDLKLMTSTYTNQITNAKKEGINKCWSRRNVLDFTKNATSADGAIFVTCVIVDDALRTWLFFENIIRINKSCFSVCIATLYKSLISFY